jgi:hypothetical protein
MTSKKETTILKLPLEKEPFQVMVTGEKKEEFRKNKKWMTSRLIDGSTGQPKPLKFIRFTNGYGNDKPYFICEYSGFTRVGSDFTPRTYSNGLVVSDVQEGDYIIHCGNIVETGNLK